MVTRLFTAICSACWGATWNDQFCHRSRALHTFSRTYFSLTVFQWALPFQNRILTLHSLDTHSSECSDWPFHLLVNFLLQKGFLLLLIKSPLQLRCWFLFCFVTSFSFFFCKWAIYFTFAMPRQVKSFLSVWIFNS